MSFFVAVGAFGVLQHRAHKNTIAIEPMVGIELKIFAMFAKGLHTYTYVLLAGSRGNVGTKGGHCSKTGG